MPPLRPASQGLSIRQPPQDAAIYHRKKALATFKPTHNLRKSPRRSRNVQLRCYRCIQKRGGRVSCHSGLPNKIYIATKHPTFAYVVSSPFPPMSIHSLNTCDLNDNKLYSFEFTMCLMARRNMRHETRLLSSKPLFVVPSTRQPRATPQSREPPSS